MVNMRNHCGARGHGERKSCGVGEQALPAIATSCHNLTVETAIRKESLCCKAVWECAHVCFDTPVLTGMEAREWCQLSSEQGLSLDLRWLPSFWGPLVPYPQHWDKRHILPHMAPYVGGDFPTEPSSSPSPP